MASQGPSRKLDAKYYRSMWEKASTPTLSNKSVSNFVDEMIQKLRSTPAAVMEDKGNSQQEAIDDITKFLYDEPNRNIDSCVRWAILHCAAAQSIEEGESPERNAPALLVQAIAGREGHLAFEVLNSESTSTLQEECKARRKDPDNASAGPDHSRFGKDLKENPFFQAVHASRNAAATKSMLDSLKQYCSEQVKLRPAKRRSLLRKTTSCQDANTKTQEESDESHELLLIVLQKRFTIVNNAYTALQLASDNEAEKHRKLGVLKELLGCHGIADNDDTFDEAMKDGRVEVVKVILSQKGLSDKFVTSENIIKAMNNIGETSSSNSGKEDDIRVRRLAVLYELLKKSDDQNGKHRRVFNSQVAQKIIELNLEDAWNMRPDNAELRDTCLLHIAVYHQHVNFVERFLEDYPASVSRKALVPGTKMAKRHNNKNSRDNTGEEQRDQQGYYPLWYNRKKWDEGNWVDRKKPGPDESIRRLLVEATIRQVDKMQRLSGLFREAEVDELCFDISQFNSKLYRVSEFVHSLINHQENEGLLLYEPTIKYARFPPLDVHIDDKEAFGRAAQEEHTEVFDILDWLKHKKQVRSIIELKVPDRLVNPHNERLIAKYADAFSIEILDWRFLDMSLSVFRADTVKPRIRELHLYSSGKQAAISHWFTLTDESLLQQLRSLRIHVVQEMMSKRHCDDTVEHISENLKELQSRWASMRAEVEKKAEEEKSKTEKEKKVDAEKEMQRAAEEKKMKKSIHKKAWETGGKGVLKTMVSSQLWNPTHERLASLDELAQRAFPRIASFIRNYNKHVGLIPHVDCKDKDPELEFEHPMKNGTKRRFRPTKVAIIDNGILSIAPVPIETPLSSRALARFNKNNNTNANTNTWFNTNNNYNNSKERERNHTKTATSPWSSSRTDKTVTPQTIGTRPPKTTSSLPNRAAYDDFVVASSNTGTTNNAAAAAARHRTQDEDRWATKGRNHNKGHGTLWSRIKEGQSFVDDDYRVSPWLFASDPHGTQMANLICSIDPACELYVAKVTDGNNLGISPERVIRAIEWAISRDVDIISMSFTIFEHRAELEEVIEEAERQGIVMMCSNHDEGANHQKSYPADYDQTWVVTACDEYGFAPREINSPELPKKPGYHYKFQGLNVAAGVIHFLESNDRISGSSVATAIASGISSLIISCARLNMCNPAEGWHGESCLLSGSGSCVAQTQCCEGGNRRRIVSHFLKSMMPDQSNAGGYVLLEKFGEIDAKVKEGEEVFVAEVLRNWFSPLELKKIVTRPQ